MRYFMHGEQIIGIVPQPEGKGFMAIVRDEGGSYSWNIQDCQSSKQREVPQPRVEPAESPGVCADEGILDDLPSSFPVCVAVCCHISHTYSLWIPVCLTCRAL